MSTFTDLIGSPSSEPGDHLLLDGSMGTELFRRGLPSGLAPEVWNLDRPEVIRAVHEDHVTAGAGLILTNTFGGTAHRLALHGLSDRVVEINRTAATIACAASGAAVGGRPVIVAGSMGPTGELIEPLGQLTAETCRASFAEQVEGLVDGGVDVLWIETMSSLDEVELAVAGARAVTDLPICVTLSFDTAGRTMMGVCGRDAAERLGPLGLAGIGANCGNDLAASEAALAEIVDAIGSGDRDAVRPAVISKCNAGIPEWRDGALRYDATPERMAAHGARARSLGAELIGGCCGTTPEHLALMGRVLRGEEPVPDVAAPAVARTRVAGGPARRDRARRAGRRRPGGDGG